MYKKVCTIYTTLVFFYLALLHFLINNNITEYIFLLYSIYALIYYFYICVYLNIFPQREIIPPINSINVNIQPEPDIIIIKVKNISELNDNFDNTCCICLEYIDPIDSYKLNDCDYHLYHQECIKLYINNNFKKCPICNV